MSAHPPGVDPHQPSANVAYAPPPQLDVGAVLSTILQVFVRSFPVLVGAAALAKLPELAATAFLFWKANTLVPPVLEALDPNAWFEWLGSFLLAALPALATVLVLTFVTGGFVRACVVELAHRTLHEEPTSLGTGIAVAARRLLPLLGLSILWGLCVSAGLFLCCVPGILVALAFAVSAPVCVLERRGPIASLSRSLELTSGHWTEILLVYLALVSVYVVGYCAFESVASLAVASLARIGGGSAPIASALAQALVGYVEECLAGVVFGITTTVLYVRIRSLREPDGLNTTAALDVFR